MVKLLLLMVLTSAAASTQTTILPTARTTLSMAAYKSIPDAFGKVHKRFLTPTTSTVAMGAVSIALYVAMNYLSNGSSVIGDSVSALGAMIAFYYGLTGFACVWYYRKSLTESARTSGYAASFRCWVASSCGSSWCGSFGTTASRPATATPPGRSRARTRSSVACSSSSSLLPSSASSSW